MSSFHNLTMISVHGCHKMKYLFSPLMAALLSNLKEIEVYWCDGMEEVVSKRDDDDDETTTPRTLFPLLQSLRLYLLESLRDIGGGGGGSKSNKNKAITTTSIIHHDVQPNQKYDQGDIALWSLCQYPKEIFIVGCNALSRLIPSHAAGHMQNLNKLAICACHGLRDVFTFSTLESLKQLTKLKILYCPNIQVIVKEEEEDGDHATLPSSNNKVVVFPCLKSLILIDLRNLNGFFLDMNYDFLWPSLDTVKIVNCPKMTRFTHVHSTSPVLKYIHTKYGKHGLECITVESQESSSQGSTSSSVLEMMPPPCSFSNLEEIYSTYIYGWRKYIIPSIKLQELQNLEKINLSSCYHIVEIFETCEGLNESYSVVKLPKLTQVHLDRVFDLKHIWKNTRLMVMEFPSLTTISISECNKLTHVFSYSMVGSLLQLQELHISACKSIGVIIKEEEEEIGGDNTTRVDEVELPSLKSLTFSRLKSMKGFYLGRKAFHFPSLETLDITSCPQLMVFNNERLKTPKLKAIGTDWGLCDPSEDFITFITTMKQEGLHF